MKIRHPGPLVLYLLHFEKPVGRAKHYLGSTFERHLALRLRAHGRKRGAALTAAAVEGGGRIALAAVWGALSRQEEMRLKRAGHFSRRCPICQGDLRLEDAAIVPTEGKDISAWNALLWPATVLRGPGEPDP